MRTISVTAYGRPDYLDATLKALSRCVGIEKYAVRVFCDKHHYNTPRCVSIAERYGFSAVASDRHLGPHQNTGLALRSSFEAGAHYHIHMEEDTTPSRGALLWFEWAERLGADERFFSVTGYNRVPTGSVSEWGARAWFHPWGFATWADRWAEIAWAGAITESWDVRLNRLRGERVEAFPCVSRMQNIGALGGACVPNPEWHEAHHRAQATTDDLISVFAPVGS